MLSEVKFTVVAVLALAGLKFAVTPTGNPATVKLTGLANPLLGLTVIVLPAAESGPRVIAVAEAERLKLGTVTSTLVLPELFPEFPVIFTLYLPGATLLLAVRIIALLPLVTAGLKLAVIPSGTPEAESVTSPDCPEIKIVLLLFDPGGKVTLLASATIAMPVVPEGFAS